MGRFVMVTTMKLLATAIIVVFLTAIITYTAPPKGGWVVPKDPWPHIEGLGTGERALLKALSLHCLKEVK